MLHGIGCCQDSLSVTPSRVN